MGNKWITTVIGSSLLISSSNVTTTGSRQATAPFIIIFFLSYCVCINVQRINNTLIHMLKYVIIFLARSLAHEEATCHRMMIFFSSLGEL